MSGLSPLEKEIRFLYTKHNKTTQYPLEIEHIEFPKYIIKILEKKTKRTKEEAKKLDAFRKRVLYDLQLRSWRLQEAAKEIEEAQKKERQKKLLDAQDLKFQNDPTKVKHFGMWFDNNAFAKLNRENYVIIDKKVYDRVSSYSLQLYKEKPEKRMLVYENEECTIFSDAWCEKHREECLWNFDLNMAFFASLDKAKFEKALQALLKRGKKFREIFNIRDCDKMVGIYIMVLDEYKQLYIGQSCDIKKRITQHWRAKKEFSRLIFGDVKTSVLSIDSFGCLDTTRIFVMEYCSDIDAIEQQLVEFVDPKFLLNRTAGGIKGNDIFAVTAVLAGRNKRKL